jgi:hypothetical protein
MISGSQFAFWHKCLISLRPIAEAVRITTNMKLEKDSQMIPETSRPRILRRKAFTRICAAPLFQCLRPAVLYRLRIGSARPKNTDSASEARTCSCLQLFRTIPNTFGLPNKSVSAREKLDKPTLKVLTIGSYVICKSFGHKKAVPHRTERRF